MHILSTQYLPCLEWWKAIISNPQAIIDTHEHYLKQTYRNRTRILSANGPLELVIPIKKIAHHTPVHQILLENDFPWQHQHWQAIVSAYGSAPYFLHYKHYFEKWYHTPFTHLADWNHQLLLACCEIMKLDWNIIYATSYIKADDQDNDWRNIISPKKKSDFESKPYLQIFAEKFPFQPNLSILDLVFNQGPRWCNFI
jgi:hypothetical protein